MIRLRSRGGAVVREATISIGSLFSLLEGTATGAVAETVGGGEIILVGSAPSNHAAITVTRTSSPSASSITVP